MKKEEKNETSKNAVIYCRVSTKEQVNEGNSLVSQERLCREYAAQEGYNIIEIFIEKGESAKTAKRKELQRLLDFCKENKGLVQALIAYKVDRISRNIADYSYIKVQLKKYKVVIKSVTEFFEDTPAGRFMENIIANVSQFDNDVRAERSTGGMMEAVQEGRYVWNAPVGYDNIKINGKGSIAPNKNAPLVKEAFELVASRTASTELIWRMIIEKGLVNSRGKPVHKSHFFRLLRDPIYAGKIKKFGKSYQGSYEPLVTVDLFEDVQAALEGRMFKSRHYIRENPDFPLRRFVFNNKERPLSGYWAKGRRLKYPYYSFNMRGSTIRKEILEERFLEFVDHFSFDSSHLKFLREQLVKHFNEKLDKETADNGAIPGRISEINQQIDGLIKIHSSGGISVQTLTERVQKLEAELDALKRISRSKNEIDVDLDDLMKFAAKVLKKPSLLWLKSPIDQQKLLQWFEFPDGLLFDGESFRTTKICSIFQVKTFLDNRKSIRVRPLENKTNTCFTPSFTLLPNTVLKTKDFWEEIVHELGKLKIIVDS